MFLSLYDCYLISLDGGRRRPITLQPTEAGLNGRVSGVNGPNGGWNLGNTACGCRSETRYDYRVWSIVNFADTFTCLREKMRPSYVLYRISMRIPSLGDTRHPDLLCLASNRPITSRYSRTPRTTYICLHVTRRRVRSGWKPFLLLAYAECFLTCYRTPSNLRFFSMQSYVLHQEKNVLCMKASEPSSQAKPLARSRTRKQSVSGRIVQPLISVPPPFSVSTTNNVVFEPGSLLAKRNGDLSP